MEVEIMNRDTLYLLQPGFEDPAYPGQKFYCEHCALMEGVLASFPELGKDLDIKRVAWPRPRHEVIALVGEENITFVHIDERGSLGPSDRRE